jgi:hypothetical protein
MHVSISAKVSASTQHSPLFTDHNKGTTFMVLHPGNKIAACIAKREQIFIRFHARCHFLTTMDPVSVSASIIAILASATKISIVIYDIVRQVKNTPPELAAVRHEIESLSPVLEHLKAAVDTNNAEAEDGTKTRDTKLALASCMSVMMEVESKVNFLHDRLLRGRFNKWKHFLSWSSEKQELRDLQSRLLHSKNTLLLSINVLT